MPAREFICEITNGSGRSADYHLGVYAGGLATPRRRRGWRLPAAAMRSPWPACRSPETRRWLDAGLDFAIGKNATLGVSYSGQFGSGVTNNGVRANLLVKF